ncbi:MAG: hypothetical protein KF762_13010, partial [Acidobacteria bacterium]|nr:hypothetical protein [Acidobacteriota bacterium]
MNIFNVVGLIVTAFFYHIAATAVGLCFIFYKGSAFLKQMKQMNRLKRLKRVKRVKRRGGLSPGSREFQIPDSEFCIRR